MRSSPASNRVQLLAGVATAVIAVLVVATFVYVRTAGSHTGIAASGTRTSPSASPLASESAIPSPAPSPTPVLSQALPGSTVPAFVIDVAPVSHTSGFALLTNCNGGVRATCVYAVSATYDAGDHWSATVQVGSTHPTDEGGAPRHVFFMNPTDGFVYGYDAAYATHDGGKTWTPIGVKATALYTIVASGRLAWVVTYPCPKGTPCPYEVRSSADQGRTWSAAQSMPATFTNIDAIAFGSQGLLVPGGGGAGMEVTTNGGASWSHIGARCGGGVFAELNTTSDGQRLIKDCIDQVIGTTVAQRLLVSSDGGRTWTTTPLNGVGPFLPEVGFPILLVSTGAPNTAVAASIRATIALTRDGGVSWTEVGPQNVGFSSIRFANPSDGWALDVYRNIWVTSDGGRTWNSAAGVPMMSKP